MFLGGRAWRWRDVDLVAGHLMVRRSLWQDQEGLSKGGLNRKVLLSDVAIATPKAQRHLNGAYVFSDEAGDRLSRRRAKKKPFGRPRGGWSGKRDLEIHDRSIATRRRCPTFSQTLWPRRYLSRIHLFALVLWTPLESASVAEQAWSRHSHSGCAQRRGAVLPPTVQDSRTSAGIPSWR